MRLLLLLLLSFMACKSQTPATSHMKDALPVTDTVPQNKTDISQQAAVKKMLYAFYTAYITSVAEDENNLKIKQLIADNCTQRLKKQLAKQQPDYDPFINAQDADISCLSTLNITPKDEKGGIYHVSYTYSAEQYAIIVTVAEEGGKYKIDRVKPLPIQ